MASIRSVSSVSATANNVPASVGFGGLMPATRENGDLLLAFTSCRSATATVATPAGWDLLVNVAGTYGRIALFGRVVDGTETFPTITWSGLTTGTSGSPAIAQVVAVTDLDTSGGAAAAVNVVGAISNQAAATNFAAGGAAITTTVANAVVFVISTRQDDAGTWATLGTSDTITWTKVSPTSITTSGADMAFEQQFGTRAAAGSVAGKQITLSGASSFASSGVMIAFKSAPPPVPLHEDSIDTFNRADGLVDAGVGAAIWTREQFDGSVGPSDLRTISNQLGKVAASPAWQSAYTRVEIDNSTGNFDVLIDCAVVPVGPNNEFSFHPLYTFDPSPGAFDSYGVIWAGGTWLLRKYVGGTNAGNIASAAGTLAVGDTLWFAKRGSSLKVYKRPSGGSFALILSTTESTHNPARCFVAVELSDSTQRWDNLRGGPVAVAVPKTYPRTASDSWTVSDSVARVFTPRPSGAASDTWTVSDAVTRGPGGALAPGPSYVAEVLTDSPALYWRLGESSGVMVDSSGNGRDGTVIAWVDTPLRGVPGLLTGDSDKAVNLNAGRISSNYDPFVDGTVRTFEVWIGPKGLDAGSTLVLSELPIHTFMLARAGANLQVNGQASLLWQNAIPITGSHHVVLIVKQQAEQSLFEIFVDGVSKGTRIQNYFNYTSGTFHMGYTSGGSTAYDGTLDEVAIYEYGLPLPRIRAHYAAGRREAIAQPPVLTSLAAWYRGASYINSLNQIGWTDESGNARHAIGSGPARQDDALNGHPVVRFDGVDDLLTASTLLANQAERTIIIVAKSANPSPNYLRVWSFNTTFSGVFQQGGQWHACLQPTAVIAFPMPNAVEDWHVLTLRLNSTVSADLFTDSGAGLNFAPDSGYFAGGVLRIASLDAGSYHFGGDIAEVIIYDRALSDIERQQVETYLNDKYLAAPLPPAAGVMFTRTAFDIVAVSDSATGAQQVNLVVTATDLVVTSDAAVRAAGARARTATDSWSRSDTANRATANRVRGATDSWTCADTANRAATAKPRTAVDTWATGDTAASIKVVVRTALDAWTVVGAVTRGSVTFTRTAFDTVAFGDVAAKTASTKIAYAVDTVVVSSTASRTTGTKARAAVDSWACSDSVAAVKIGGVLRTATDLVVMSDAAVRAVVARVRAAVDTWSWSDSASGIKVIPRTAMDSWAVVGTATRISSRPRPVSDVVVFSDTATRAIIARVRIATDLWAVSSSALRSTVRIRAAYDMFIVVDLALRKRTLPRLVVDSFTVSDIVEAQTGVTYTRMTMIL